MIPHDFVDESAFTPEFLERCTDLELVALQHELRQYPEDRRYLNVVLEELAERQKRHADIARTPDPKAP